MIEIKTWRDPYDAGFSPTRPMKVNIEEGLTVLVGCNGAGKTTLLRNIETEMKKQNIPCHLYDNMRDGNSNAISGAFFSKDYALGALLITSSEGECIKMNVSNFSKLFHEFLETGFMNTSRNRMARLFSDGDIEVNESDIRILLFDAIDSGLSVDSIIEVKTMCKSLLEEARTLGKKLYIIISANEYELARNSKCFDVNSGKYITFADYEAYRNFIINSRARKEKRIEKQIQWNEKQCKKKEEAYQRFVEKLKKKIDEINNRAISENRELSFWEKHQIDDFEREIIRKKPDWME